MDERTASPSREMPIVRSTLQARQGVTGHNVRYVLLISLGAAILLMAVIWLAFVR